MEWALELDGAQGKEQNKDDKWLPDVQIDMEKAELTSGWVEAGGGRDESRQVSLQTWGEGACPGAPNQHPVP